MKDVVTEYSSKMAEAKWTFLRSLKESDENNPLTEDENKYALSHLNPSHVTTNRSVDIRKYAIGASFKVSMVNYILEKKYYKNFSIAPSANDKLVDARFVSSLGYPVPNVVSRSASLAEACEYKGYIVKSITGAASKGVFLNNGNSFFHFFDRKEYSKDEFLRYCSLQNLKKFIVEEYVGGNKGVTDLKFYMFYGEVGVALEVKRGEAGNQHCFYNSGSDIINTGRYKETAFKGAGFSDAQRNCAVAISKAIPSPFVRVDLIVNDGNFWVGEITAHPGGFEEFNKEVDFLLGERFIEARARLMEDLLNGKKFDEYLKRYNYS
ncbi:ATP-grasp fold amidoligase family protein [Halomonas sp. AOP42-A1-14]|uniref:ATP-grasp fold amidoligase family protein n=1 Tax=Halomonas sp. AOP42-A1-14 TaxID=3457676 RepID=UPI004033441D